MSADIDYTIGLITKEFETAIRKNEQVIKQFNDNFKKQTQASTSAWDSFVGNLSAQTFLNIASSIQNMGMSFVDAASQIEDTTVQFEVLTGSATTAKKLVEELSEFGAKTPFEMQGISTAAKSLMAYGFTATEVVPKLQQIGDAASATGNSLADVAQVYGQVAATGKITGERLNQFQEKGIPILAAIATQLGVTSDKAREMISSTNGVPFATFEKAFAGLSEKGGIAFEGMIKQSKTLSGVISSAKDEVIIFAAQMGQKLLPTIKSIVLMTGDLINVFRNMVKWTEKNTDTFLSIAGGITAATLATVAYLNITTIATTAMKLASASLLAYNFVVSTLPIYLNTTSIAQWALNTAVMAFPGIIIVSAIGLVVAGLVLLYRNFDKVTVKAIEMSITVLKAIEPLETGFRFVFGSILEIAARTYGTLIQSTFQLAEVFTSAFGIQLPDTFTYFGENMTNMALEFKNGSGAIKGQIDSLILSADELQKKMAGPMGPPKPSDADLSATGEKQTKADQIRAEQLAKEKAFQDQLRMMRMDHNAQMDLVDQEHQLAVDQLAIESDELSLEQRQAKQEEAIVNAYDFELAKVEATRQAELAKASLLTDAQDKAKAVLAANQTAELAREKAQGKYKVDIAKQVVKEKKELADQEKLIQDSILTSLQGYLGIAASMMKKGSREAKALAIVDATIATYLAATKAFNQVPFPANILASGVVIAQGLQNVHRITSTGGGNFANGGIVPGHSLAGDQVPIYANSGEVVLDHAKTNNLANKLNSRGMPDEQVDRIINAIGNMRIVVQADDNEIARSVSRGVINGIIIGETR